MTLTIDNPYALVLARMYQMERVLSWLDQVYLSAPVWPLAVDISREKQEKITRADDKRVQTVSQTITALEQRNQWVQQGNVSRENAQMNQAHTTANTWHQKSVPHQPQTTLRQMIIAPSTVPPSSGLANHSVTSAEKTNHTHVTVSPTIHLQATLREQADLEQLMAKLNHMLEQEIAVSAERAYR